MNELLQQANDFAASNGFAALLLLAVGVVIDRRAVAAANWLAVVLPQAAGWLAPRLGQFIEAQISLMRGLELHGAQQTNTLLQIAEAIKVLDRSLNVLTATVTELNIRSTTVYELLIQDRQRDMAATETNATP